MDIQIIGDGSFGSFLKKELPSVGFNIVDDAKSVILAVPISAYNECGSQFKNKHLINVCSVQDPSTDILLKHTDKVTSIYPLFGSRTPADKRYTIGTYFCGGTSEFGFLELWKIFSSKTRVMSPQEHDEIMFLTHVKGFEVLEFAKPIIDAAADIPDEFIPNSFRLLRQLAKTLEDMPAGTIESIMANENIKK